MDNFWQTKDILTDAVKDIDESKGIVTGYLSVFNVKDSDGDVITPGAFKKSLKENGPDSEKPRIVHLYMHDINKPVGKYLTLKEDKKGLYFEAKISVGTQLGKDLIQLYKDGVLKEHSIGYQVVKRQQDDREETQYLNEVKLWEGSTVTWGANMEALVNEVKDARPTKQAWKMLTDKLESLQTAITGEYSDDMARMIEIQFKQLQQLILSLATKVVPEDSTPVVDEPKGISAEEFIKILKSTI